MLILNCEPEEHILCRVCLVYTYLDCIVQTEDIKPHSILFFQSNDI